ncbi:hypothetical protein GCM10007425_12230 [Lysinibacillus alkalisoli]|uniref:Dynamin N-terminal domain-containing protein n=1 Tax=Lysinibacillus alkalisoli TaxID=1911548 RepID=A0A917LFU4_9BACI|nr:dynamin family protein [Lysinibacillus alkalisoli]GGG19266.1 hypothetical protein GCM10007425_12230 [Lysinibacillus alkalisoli]
MEQHNAQFWEKILLELADKLDQVSQTIADNTYIVETKRQLRQIIADARNETLVLFLGNRQTGKSTIINGLIGREVLIRKRGEMATANTFVRYGEHEHVKAFFYDEVVEDFGLKHLPLLTNSENFTSQILQDHIDYVDVFVKSEILKKMTLIDALAVKREQEDAMFLSHSLIQRIDEVFWVLRPDFEITQDEVALIEHLQECGIMIHVLINQVVDRTINEKFIQQLQQNYAHLFTAYDVVDALAIENYVKTGDVKQWEKSQFMRLSAKLQTLSAQKEQRTRRILLRFIEWLERFDIETSLLPEREPLLSAVQELERYHANVMLETAKQQESIAAIQQHEKSYQKAAKVFEQVRTLYQLVQQIEGFEALQNSTIEDFIAKANTYLQKVLTYRQAYKMYEDLCEQTNEQHVLDEAYQEMVAYYNEIAEAEMIVVSLWDGVEPQIKQLHRDELTYHYQTANRIMTVRQQELAQLKLSVVKMTEFNCLIEAQGILRDVVWPYIKQTALPINEREQVYIETLIQQISHVDLSGNGILARSGAINAVNEKRLESLTNYVVHELSLEENGLKSADIPPLPDAYQLP